MFRKKKSVASQNSQVSAQDVCANVGGPYNLVLLLSMTKTIYPTATLEVTIII
jgi:hypothetical protein